MTFTLRLSLKPYVFLICFFTICLKEVTDLDARCFVQQQSVMRCTHCMRCHTHADLYLQAAHYTAPCFYSHLQSRRSSVHSLLLRNQNVHRVTTKARHIFSYSPFNQLTPILSNFTHCPPPLTPSSFPSPYFLLSSQKLPYQFLNKIPHVSFCSLQSSSFRI